MASDYRLSVPLTVRLVGAALVVVAVLVFATTFVAVLAGWGLASVMGVGAVGLVAVVALAAWARRAISVHLDDRGYRVRFVRGVGVASGAWSEVEDLVANEVGGTPCLTLRRKDGMTTSIPLDAVDATSEAFADDLRAHLERGHGLRRL